MTDLHIRRLLEACPPEGAPRLFETHISWVLLCGPDAFKFKKPVELGFIDLRELAQRRHYCERELRLNTAFAPGLYLGLRELRLGPDGQPSLAPDAEGELLDYAVHMKRLDNALLLERQLAEGRVEGPAVEALAGHIANIHRHAPLSEQPASPGAQREAFNGIAAYAADMEAHLGLPARAVVRRAVALSDMFLLRQAHLLQQRVLAGWQRLLHGDLHAGNIFLGDPPTLFDCIEFNDDWRRLDLLSEIAYLCVGFDVARQPHLGDIFLRSYLSQLPCLQPEESPLLLYYKLYRANVRAKVLFIKHMSTRDEALAEQVRRHLLLMEQYGQQMHR